MIHGTVIRVLQDGPRIPAAALAPIGIHDHSRCWGVWVSAHAARSGVFDEATHGTESPPAHLLISPIHPDLWPYVFHVEIKLRDRLGAMADVADILYNNNINLVFVQCTPSGHQHATWSFIGEALDVKEKVEARRHQNYHSAAERRESIWKQARFLMITKLLSLRTELESADSLAARTYGEGSRFLYDRFMLEGLEFSPDDVRTFMPDVTEETLRAAQLESASQRTKSIKHRVAAHLAHVWKTASPDRLEFEYSTDDQQLILRSADFTDQIERYVGEGVLPTDALSSFETQEHYLRLKLLVRRSQKRLIAVQVRYNAVLARGIDKGQSTIGALRDVTRIITNNDINLLEVSNAVTARDAQTEKGSIKLVGETHEADNQEFIEKTKRQIKEIRIANRSPAEVWVEPHHHAHIFVSRRADPETARTTLFNKLDFIIRETASEFSIQVIESSAWRESASHRVLEDIRQADAVIQILTLKEKETRARCDLTWLVTEYAAAAALNKPCVRLADTSRGLSDVDWLAIVRFSNCAIQPFDSRKTDEELRDVFRRAFVELNKSL